MATMKVRLEYGKNGLEVELPDKNVVGVLRLQEAVRAADAAEAVRTAIQNAIGARPLTELARGKTDACIVVCDVTRPVPNPIVLGEVLDALELGGLASNKVKVLIATGTHRPNDDQELRNMLGDRVMAECEIINHFCTDSDDMVHLGASPNGVPIWLNRHYVHADLKITAGMIEPHFMAGFAGGRKMVMPGVAALETIQAWHSPQFLEDPLATNGVIEDNPVHLEATWIANQCRPDFIVDVALDNEKKIAKVFAGDMEQAWETGVRYVQGLTQAEIEGPIDICVTTCGGHPLDLTYYQTVKGMVGPLPIVRPGGAIIVASECSEGIGNHHFRDALFRVGDIRTWLERAISGEWERVADQWQIEELAKAVRNHRVYVVASGISQEELAQLHVRPAPTVEAAVAECMRDFGPESRICVIPKGPYVLPVLKSVSSSDS